LLDACEPPAIDRTARGMMLIRLARLDAAFGGELLLSEAAVHEVLAEYGRTFTDPHVAKLFAGFRGIDMRWEEVKARIEIPDRAIVRAMIDRVFAPIIADSSKPRHERSGESVLLPDAPRVLFDEYINLEAIRMLELQDDRDRLTVVHTGLRIMLALELFRAKHARFPDTLDALVPEILDALPSDPWTGQQYRYRLSADGKSYALYSIGADGVDNGGIFDERAPSSAFSQPHLNLDFPINHPLNVPVIPVTEVWGGQR
jgi:hypothetical protein